MLTQVIEIERDLTFEELSMTANLPDYQRENYRDTPNVEFLDEWLDGGYYRYSFEKLKDYTIDDLHKAEQKIKRGSLLNNSKYPNEGGLEGDTRAAMLGNPNEDRESLTSRERERIYQAKSDFIQEIRRARGHVKEQKGNRIVRTLGNIADRIVEILRTLFP